VATGTGRVAGGGEVQRGGAGSGFSLTVFLRDGEHVYLIVLCVDEAASNAVEHAYPDVVGTIDIQATRTTPDRPVRRSR
jgi:hypothetical protein